MDFEQIIEPKHKIQAMFDRERFNKKPLACYGLTKDGEVVPLVMSAEGEFSDPREDEDFVRFQGKPFGQTTKAREV